MLTTATLRSLPFDDALALADRGVAIVDLRTPEAYLEVHIPGSLSLVYERGPGLAARARDCLPLSLPLMLSEAEGVDHVHAAASLRGKGFTVVGLVPDAINGWAHARGVPASTEVASGTLAGTGTVLDVGDPRSPHVDEAVRIPLDQLWVRVGELRDAERVAITMGYGVRAALAVGILERAGIDDVVLWKGPA